MLQKFLLLENKLGMIFEFVSFFKGGSGCANWGGYCCLNLKPTKNGWSLYILRFCSQRESNTHKVSLDNVWWYLFLGINERSFKLYGQLSVCSRRIQSWICAGLGFFSFGLLSGLRFPGKNMRKMQTLENQFTSWWEFFLNCHWKSKFHPNS